MASETIDGTAGESPDSFAGMQLTPGYRPELQKLPQKKIAILGTCPSRLQAPVGDISWEIWTIGPGGKNSNRWERLFEIHGKGSWPEGFREYLEELKAEKPPKIIYTEEPMPDWPANVVFPKQAMFEKYGRMWFTSSIAYALAMALEENVTDMGCWGIDLESGEEYRSQFTAAKYFLHLARLAGVNMWLPEGCGLLRDPHPYPEAWESHLAQTIMAKQDFLQQILSSKTTQHGQLAAEINHISGELAAFEFIKKTYVIGGEQADARLPTTQKPSLESKIDMLIALLRSK